MERDIFWGILYYDGEFHTKFAKKNEKRFLYKSREKHEWRVWKILNYWEWRVSYIIRQKKQGGGEVGSDFEATHTGYYCRETLVEVIQNQEGVSYKIRDIIWGKKKRRGGSLQSWLRFIPAKILFEVDN